MNEIRQLCTTSSSPGKHLDEILALFQACPPQHRLPSLSLIGQSISCMSIEQLDINIINHPLFLVIRHSSERLLQSWLNNTTLNGHEYRAIFYIYQLFKLVSEWLIEQDHMALDNKNKELIKRIIKNLFLEENFINTLCRVINQLINNENDEQHSLIASHSSDNDNHVSPDDIQFQTHISDIQAEQADIVDVLFRCVNTLLTLYSHPILLNSSLVDQNLTSCIINCLNTPLFIQLSTEFLRQNITYDQINIRSVFLLFTCLDYCISSAVTQSTLQLLPSINQIFHIWSGISHNFDDDISPLIIRLIRFINQLAFIDKDAIIRANLCSYLIPYFDILCQTSNLIDDISSLLVTLCSTTVGKKHLRHLGFVPHILYGTKRYAQLWRPLTFLITQQDLYETSLLKRLIHLLTQRTINIFQSLTTASNDTSFDSALPSSKNHVTEIAIDWFILLRTNFLTFLLITDGLINSTKKGNFINMLIDTILFVQQDDDIHPKLIDVMIEFLWTFSFNTSTNIHDSLQKRIDLCQWLKMNTSESIPSIRLTSQGLLSTLDLNTKTLNRSTVNRHSSIPTNNLICLINADESHRDLCMTLRDRLQIEQQYSVELILTSTCQSIDSLIHLINRSSLGLFCASIQMKSDNLSHFIHYYMSHQSQKIPMLTILTEQDCEINGNWLENIPVVDKQSILKQIRRYLNQNDDNQLLQQQQTNNSHIQHSINSDEIHNQSKNYMQRPVSYWSADDVTQWCEAAQGNFETLRPLVKRLNGPALVHLAEILSIEPASMYHSLNSELIQRTGSNVPLTEYVSLRSELQRLLIQKQNECLTTNASMNNKPKKKKWRHSRFCTLI
ncbi:unnamed protein product [Adineta steineri]|uniref:Uncharacterized protein n=1 Tax=Adineta steineri TaxID=433720 RepID=A0A815B3Q7_9BILA|nr:unnamed protein product [Adineta steineri]CAF1264521.1 unnamed protein product [Adineta steineri]